MQMLSSPPSSGKTAFVSGLAVGAGAGILQLLAWLFFATVAEGITFPALIIVGKAVPALPVQLPSQSSVPPVPSVPLISCTLPMLPTPYVPYGQSSPPSTQYGQPYPPPLAWTNPSAPGAGMIQSPQAPSPPPSSSPPREQ